LLDQRIVPVQLVAVNVATSSPQSSFLFAVTCGGNGTLPEEIVTSLEATLNPHELVQVAVYFPTVFTEIESPEAPLLQVTEPEQFNAFRTVDSPSQIEDLFALMVGASGFNPVVIATLFEAPLVPQVAVQVAVYVPAVLTMICVPVSPVLQVTVPVQLVALITALSPVQTEVLFGLIVGAAGVVPVTIVTSFDLALVPQLLLHVAL
jgi:hypothetical protein